MIADDCIRRVQVTRVVDGDTFVGVVDLLYGIKRDARFRLLGVNTPEKGQPGAKEATEFMRTAIEGKEVFVQSQKPDAFGRYLATVYTDGVEQSINDELLFRGLAKIYKRGE